MNDLSIALLALAASTVTTQVASAASRAILPPVGRRMRIDGRHLHVLDQGKGPAVLMIHGLAGQLNNFAPIWPLLPGRRVIAYDRWGAGHSDAAPKGAEALGEQAALAARLLERLDTGPALLVGHSLGGAVSLRLALDRPDLVRGLVLLAPLACAFFHGPAIMANRLNRVPWLRWALQNSLSGPALAVSALSMLRDAFHPDPMPWDFQHRLGGALFSQPRAIEGATRDLHVVTRDMAPLQADLPGLRPPLTVLFGDGDRILNPAEQGVGIRTALPDARLILLRGAGHMLPCCHPETCAAEIMRAG
ncbi:MAG: alpha/beta fold hydrolase [Paracoccus sp. (in: a-proteobacteria)]|uniref:alpha/beta fold hydrolase n=1 Tax=Paracoccus sp. TaxID=267 RepID=UPI0026DF63A4|nr:alpha/beta fold hydrolase [Paracoccus sp. (in: a-proteobacteria)]MDO5621152.1 alpha/beta fold hydrolase [Paracoccus sp. (in: a-proteobacteria)]